MAPFSSSNGVTHLLHDRDPLFTAKFRRLLRDVGTEPVRLPRKSPNLNSYAERFVLSAKSECLRRLVPLGEHHLRRAVQEFEAHYHGERPHQGLDNRLIVPGPIGTGPVRCHRRLGGTLNYYFREAA